MDAVDVVALFEGVHDDLPIALDRLADIHHGDELVDVVGLEQLDDLDAQVFPQRWGAGIGVQEDEAGEGVHRHRQQRVLFLVDRPGKVLAQHSLQPAIQVVGPEVVLAQEAALGISGFGDAQSIAAMPTRIDETA